MEDYSTFFSGDDDDFSCTITPPADVDVIVKLYHEGDLVYTKDDFGMGSAESFTYESTWGYDDDGTYTVEVTSYSGSSCSDPVDIYCIKLDDDSQSVARFTQNKKTVVETVFSIFEVMLNDTCEKAV